MEMMVRCLLRFIKIDSLEVILHYAKYGNTDAALIACGILLLLAIIIEVKTGKFDE